MRKILRKILSRFTHWCEVFEKGCRFSETRIGKFFYRNALDIEERLTK